MWKGINQRINIMEKRDLFYKTIENSIELCKNFNEFIELEAQTTGSPELIGLLENFKNQISKVIGELTIHYSTIKDD